MYLLGGSPAPEYQDLFSFPSFPQWGNKLIAGTEIILYQLIMHQQCSEYVPRG